MPYNGSGTFTLVAGNPVVTGTTISSTVHNNTMADIVNNGLTNAITKDGQTPITATIGFADITAVDITYTGTLTGGTGVVNIGSGQVYKAADGKFGLGTATPGVKFDIVSENNTSLAPVLRVNSNNVAVNTTIGYDCVIGSGQLQLGTSSANPVIIATNSVERARTTPGGNLLVGTTSGAVTARIVAHNPTAATAAIAAWNADTAGDNLFQVFNTEAGGTLRGTIDYNRAGGLVRYNTTSDGTLKNIKNPANLDDSVALIMSIPIDEWSWKHDENQWSQVGPIAQKLHAVFPGAVSVGGDYEAIVPATYDEDGNERTPETTETKYRPWAVDKTAPVWHLVATCQRQQQLIEDLMQRVEALEAQ